MKCCSKKKKRRSQRRVVWVFYSIWPSVCALANMAHDVFVLDVRVAILNISVRRKLGIKKTHVWARLHHHGIVDHSDYIAVKWNSEILYLFTETENRAHREREMRLKFLFVSFEFCVVSTNSPVANNEWWTVFDWPHAIQIESVKNLKFTSKCRWISSVLTKWTKSSHLRTGALSIDERAWVDIIIISALMVLFRTILYGHECAWWYFRKIGDHFSLEKLSVAAIPQIHYAENFDME